MSPIDPSLQQPGLAIPADGRWRVRVLGDLRANSGDWAISHWPSRAVSLLLARLAMYPRRSHAREELVELLWPGVALDVGRNRLRQALSTLRHLVEPPGSAAGAVIVADRHSVRLNAGAVECDAVEFERLVGEGRDAEAKALYVGELLPGFYDDWIGEERLRLAGLREQVDRRDRSAMPRSAEPSLAAKPAAAAEASNRLPGYLSTFVGRRQELSSLAAAIASDRLVTLTGTGGCGKTRLACEVARLAGHATVLDPRGAASALGSPTAANARATGNEPVAAAFDTVIFVALEACRDGAQIADRVRAAARLPLLDVPASQLLASHLADRRVLLVLDNFEQLVDRGGPQALADLLERMPRAHALVTSRRALRLPGEREIVLLPLPLPGAGDDLASAARNPSVVLFIDRARGVRGDFALTPGNLADVLDVCRVLEGLPLALEIAATRIRTYSPREMNAELAGRFALLVRTGTQGLRDPRHASLQAAIDWGWQLLSPERQAFLCDLSVFRGGCSMAEVRAVTGAEDAHEAIDALVADSLLFSQPGDDGTLRFHMLDTVRDFVAQRLRPVDAQRLRQAHRAHFMSRAMALGERHQSMPESELANFIEALGTALDDGEHALALALALALKVQWEWVGTPPEALALMRKAAAVVPVSAQRSQQAQHLSSFLAMLARLLFYAGHPAEAADTAARAVEVAGDDPALHAEATVARLRIDWIWKSDGKRLIGPAREAMALAQRVGTPDTLAQACTLVGAIVLWQFREADEAEALYTEAAQIFARLGNARAVLMTWHGRMVCMQTRGQHAAAIRLGLSHEPQAEAMGHVGAQIQFFNALALSYEKTRQFSLALDACQREARLARQRHKAYNIGFALWNQCHYLARLRRPEDAGVLMAFVERYWCEQFGPLSVSDLRHVEKIRRLVRAQVGDARCEAIWQRGRALSARDGLRLGCGDDA